MLGTWQRIVVFGTVTNDAVSDLQLSAANGYARMRLATLRGRVAALPGQAGAATAGEQRRLVLAGLVKDIAVAVDGRGRGIQQGGAAFQAVMQQPLRVLVVVGQHEAGVPLRRA